MNTFPRTAGIIGTQITVLLTALAGAGIARADCLAGGYGLDVPSLREVVAHPTEADTLFALQDAPPPDGLALLKSCDNGETWSPTALTTDFYTVLHVAVDPTSPQTVYAATTLGDLVSIDGGINWQETGMPGFTMVFATDGTFYRADGNRVYRRLPGESTWTEQTAAPAGFNVLRVHPTDSARLHAGQFMSVDGAASWQSVRSGSVQDVGYSASNPSRLIATGNPVLLSDDGGVNWYEPAWEEFEVFSYSPREGQHVAIDTDDHQRLFVVTRGCGIWRSDNDGARWRPIDNGLTGDPATCWLGEGYPAIRRLLPSPVNPDRYYVITSDGLFTSDDDGNSWRAINGSPGEQAPPPENPYSGDADLALDLYGLKKDFTPPATLRFRATIRNNGPDIARDATFSAAARAVSTTWGTCNDFGCDFGDVPPGTTIEVLLEREVLGGGDGTRCTGDKLTIAGAVSAATNDPVLSNNQDEVSSTRKNSGSLISGCPGEGLLQREGGGGSAGGFMIAAIFAALLRRRRAVK